MEDPFTRIVPSSVLGSNALEELFNWSDSHPAKATSATEEGHLHKSGAVSGTRDDNANSTLLRNIREADCRSTLLNTTCNHW